MAGLTTGTFAKTSPYGALQGYGSAVPKTPVDPLLGSPGGQLAPRGAPTTSPQASTDWFNMARAGGASTPTTYGGTSLGAPGVSSGSTPLDLQTQAQSTLQQQQIDAAAAAAERQRQASLVETPYQRAQRLAIEQQTSEASAAAYRVSTGSAAIEAANAQRLAADQAAARQAEAAATQNAETRRLWEAQNQAAIAATSQAQGFSSSMLDRQVGVVRDLMGNPVPGSAPTTPVPGSAEPAVATPAPLPRVGLGGTTSAAPVYGGGGVSAPDSRFETKGAATGTTGGTSPGGDLTSAADAAAWARAKDKIGGQTRGAITSLQGLQAARGFGGESGVYGDEERKLLGTGLTAMGDVTRGQAEDAAAAARAREAMVYQGDITQRGQDLGLSSNTMNIGLGERGQNISAATAAADRQAQLLGSYLSLIKFGAY